MFLWTLSGNHLMSSPSLASLDLGSNTFRLLIAQTDSFGRGPINPKVWQEIPRLSENLIAGGPLASEPKKRAWAALEKFDSVIKELKPQKVLAGATMTFRLAHDGADFLEKIGSSFGWETKLLTGENEARLSALGVLSALEPVPEHGLIFDIGGRSTEFIKTNHKNLAAIRSLPLGVVSLTSDYISADPPTQAELADVSEAVTGVLTELAPEFVNPETVLIGTAGTVTTLAAMLLGLTDYDSELVNNRVFSKNDLEKLFANLAGMPLNDRRLVPGLHPKRADVICAGLMEVLAVMKFFNKPKLTVSDKSLLEGLWLAAGAFVPL
jgi:exopolyphosphatase/guanosine-5'-triphosphate,3'-diphosphate pyrophosphatase